MDDGKQKIPFYPFLEWSIQQFNEYNIKIASIPNYIGLHVSKHKPLSVTSNQLRFHLAKFWLNVLMTFKNHAQTMPLLGNVKH